MNKVLVLPIVALIAFFSVVAPAQTADEIFNQGREHYAAKRYEAAISSFQNYLSKAPSDPGAYYNIGLSYQGLNRHAEAVEAFKNANIHRPNHAQTYYQIGRSYYNMKRFDESITALREATR